MEQELYGLVNDFMLEAIVALGVVMARKVLGEKVARETLHSAVETAVYGVADALADGQLTWEEAQKIVRDYVKMEGARESHKVLKATDGQITQLAASKLQKMGLKFQAGRVERRH